MNSSSPKVGVYGQKEIITRKELKPFLKRTDINGLVQITGHFAIIAITGWLLLMSRGTWWIVPALLAHGFTVSYLFAAVHECSHGTVFRRRWLNETVFNLVAFIYLVPPLMFRYSHAAHHTYTNIRGWDPDMGQPELPGMRGYLLFLSSLPTWGGYLKWMFNHAIIGKLGPAEAWHVPQSEHPRIIREARIWLGVFVAVWVVAYALGIAQELFLLWIAARLVGEPFQRWVRMAEHWGCEETGNLRRNTRTTKTSAPMHFIFWNMSYHAEHHLSPLTPFHLLPELHLKVRDKLWQVGESYPAVHREVIQAMRLGITKIPLVEEGSN